MASLNASAAMAADADLQPRVVAAVIRLALHVLSAPVAGEETPLAERSAIARRRNYALDVTADKHAYATRAQDAIACWENSTLADIYAKGGADAITDEQILGTLAAVWAATGGG